MFSLVFWSKDFPSSRSALFSENGIKIPVNPKLYMTCTHILSVTGFVAGIISEFKVVATEKTSF